MSDANLTRLFNLTQRCIGLNIEGVTHEESLVPPQGGGNTVNWVLGHIILSRYDMLLELGLTPPRTEKEMEYYREGENAGKIGEPWMLEDLLGELERSQPVVISAISGVSGAEPSEQQEKHLWSMSFYSFHESYHAGQLGLLRRLLGKTGAI